MKETEIEYNLSSYVQRIEKDIELGNFRTTKTEDFFLRVLSVVYKYILFHNQNHINSYHCIPSLFNTYYIFLSKIV